MRAPGAEHADHVAAADVDHVLLEQVGGQVALDGAAAPLAPEQRHVTGLSAAGEVAVEADHGVGGVARGRGEEADTRVLAAGEAEHEVVEQRVAGLHREAATAEGDDLRHAAGHGPSMIGVAQPGAYGQRSKIPRRPLGRAYERYR